jgi:L-fucose mutarotase/ribose pyranase (RbsD/FucU family)
MPPFRENPVIVDRRLDGEALHELRDMGHGHRVNIVDASYDIPRGARVIKYPGSSAEALLGIVRLIPIEGDVEIMERDAELADADPLAQNISAKASHAFEEVETKLAEDDIDLITFVWNYRNGEADSNGDGGFYDVADNAPKNLFVRTVDDLPFACASLIVGHSQLTE